MVSQLCFHSMNMITCMHWHPLCCKDNLFCLSVCRNEESAVLVWLLNGFSCWLWLCYLETSYLVIIALGSWQSVQFKAFVLVRKAAVTNQTWHCAILPGMSCHLVLDSYSNIAARLHVPMANYTLSPSIGKFWWVATTCTTTNASHIVAFHIQISAFLTRFRFYSSLLLCGGNSSALSASTMIICIQNNVGCCRFCTSTFFCWAGFLFRGGKHATLVRTYFEILDSSQSW